MTKSHRCLTLLAAASLSLILAACGGGSGDSSPVSATPSTASQQLAREPGAPQFTDNTASDGFSWFNFRRQQMGLAAVARNPYIDIAAQWHSDYQAVNNVITHDEDRSKLGFKGVEGCPDPLRQPPIPVEESRMWIAGYQLIAPYACGEVISAMSDASGFSAADALITAIYHRFVIFEPMFRDAGVGAASVASSRTYFTTDFGTTKGLGSGLASGTVAVYPYPNQQQLPTSFDHGTEAPDPLPEAQYPQYKNVIVGYPISVHANITSTIGVQTFTVSQGGTALPARLLSSITDPKNTTPSTAAIIPYAPLAPATTYDVRFIGQVNGLPVDRAWSFTTR